MLNFFRRKQTTDEVALLLLQTFKRLKAVNPKAKLRVPYHLKIYLLKMGFSQDELTEDKGAEIPKPVRDLPGTYVLGGDQSN